MAELLFLTPEEMTTTTIIGGNVDEDKYLICILNAQVKTIEPLLGSLLYDKIKTDLENETLIGDYEFIFKEFIKPITKYSACADYISISNYNVSNNGIFKHTPNNGEIVDAKEVNELAERYSSLAQMYVQRFEKWICKNEIEEYKTYQDEVNASSINLNNGWRF